MILALALCGVLVWAVNSPGGLRARIFGIESSIKGAVATVTQNRELDRATKTYNGWYDQQGQYPRYSQSQLDERTDWSTGMDVSWCTPRDVVLTSLTASGVVSRLLIDGKKVGDVRGRVPCPADLVSPVPWQR